MRLDMGVRANVLMDTRAAAVSEHKHAQERYDQLMRFAL